MSVAGTASAVTWHVAYHLSDDADVIVVHEHAGLEPGDDVSALGLADVLATGAAMGATGFTLSFGEPASTVLEYEYVAAELADVA